MQVTGSSVIMSDDKHEDDDGCEENDDHERATLNISMSRNGCIGCIGTVFGIIILWSLVFGVTVGGEHYGLASCSCNEGVVIDTGE